MAAAGDLERKAAGGTRLIKYWRDLNQAIIDLKPALERRRQLRAELGGVNENIHTTLRKVFQSSPDQDPVREEECEIYVEDNVRGTDSDFVKNISCLEKDLALFVKETADVSAEINRSEVTLTRNLLELNGRPVLHAANAYIDADELEAIRAAFFSGGATAHDPGALSTVITALSAARRAVSEAVSARTSINKEVARQMAEARSDPSTYIAAAESAAAAIPTQRDRGIKRQHDESSRESDRCAQDPTDEEITYSRKNKPSWELVTSLRSRIDNMFEEMAEDFKAIGEVTGLSENCIKIGLLNGSLQMIYNARLKFREDDISACGASWSAEDLGSEPPFVRVPDVLLTLRCAWYQEFVNRLKNAPLGRHSDALKNALDQQDETNSDILLNALIDLVHDAVLK